jgi:single-strand DNA-binding protein
VPIATFTLAVDKPFTNRETGAREADFIDVTAWRKLGELCAQHTRKGALVAVQGRIQIRAYDDSYGNRRKATELIAEDVRFLARSGQSASAAEEIPY